MITCVITMTYHPGPLDGWAWSACAFARQSHILKIWNHCHCHCHCQTDFHHDDENDGDKPGLSRPQWRPASEKRWTEELGCQPLRWHFWGCCWWLWWWCDNENNVDDDDDDDDVILLLLLMMALLMMIMNHWVWWCWWLTVCFSSGGFCWTATSHLYCPASSVLAAPIASVLPFSVTVTNARPFSWNMKMSSLSEYSEGKYSDKT